MLRQSWEISVQCVCAGMCCCDLHNTVRLWRHCRRLDTVSLRLAHDFHRARVWASAGLNIHVLSRTLTAPFVFYGISASTQTVRMCLCDGSGRRLVIWLFHNLDNTVCWLCSRQLWDWIWKRNSIPAITSRLNGLRLHLCCSKLWAGLR